MVLDTARLTPLFLTLRRAARLRRGLRRSVFQAMGLGLVGAVVAACTPAGGDRLASGIYRLAGSQRAPSMEMMEHSAEYSVVPASRAMVHASEALVVMERNLGAAIEQRVVLPNATALRGDNVIHIRAQTSASVRLGEFNFSELTTRFGGIPTPFQRLTDGMLMSGEDTLGSFVYASETVGAGTLCVLVLRRLTVESRPLPRGAQAMDVMMRNCVEGSLEQALAPISERLLGVSGSAQGTVYTLSPHAAPRR